LTHIIDVKPRKPGEQMGLDNPFYIRDNVEKSVLLSSNIQNAFSYIGENYTK